MISQDKLDALVEKELDLETRIYKKKENTPENVKALAKVKEQLNQARRDREGQPPVGHE